MRLYVEVSALHVRSVCNLTLLSDLAPGDSGAVARLRSRAISRGRDFCAPVGRNATALEDFSYIELLSAQKMIGLAVVYLKLSITPNYPVCPILLHSNNDARGCSPSSKACRPGPRPNAQHFEQPASPPPYGTNAGGVLVMM